MAITDELGPAGGGQPFWGLNDEGASANEAPLFSTDPWDTFFLGARQLPGECELQGVQVARIEVNKKKGKGLDGARITLAGYDPREFQVLCQIATPAQWAELEDVVDVYWRIPGKKSTLSQVTITVGHPGLAFLKIYTAVLIGITPPMPGKIDGTKVVTFSFLEAPQVPKKKNVTKSAGPPAEDHRKPSAAKLGNAPPPPPSSKPENLGLGGPDPGWELPAGAD
jgi:hypothetical protein